MLWEKYQKEIVPILVKTYQLKNKLAAPKLEKAVLNVGMGKVADKKIFEKVSQELSQISGQKPKITRARKSIAGFSLREGAQIGLMVTLRGKRMFDFLEKLFGIVLPQVKDFRGLSRKSFDNQGNWTLGLTETLVFPEIDPSKAEGTWGMEITVVTNTHDRQKAQKLLELLGAPFQKEVSNG